MKFRAMNLLVAAALALLFTACKEGNIYYTLENEVAVEDLSLPNDITIFDVAKIGTSYYAAAGKVWTVDHDAAEWNVNATVASPGAGGICTALVASPFGAQNTLFGGFINGSGNLGLYESSATPTPAAATWTVIPDPDVAGTQIALLKVENSTLVAVTAKQPTAGADFQFGIVRSINGIAFDLMVFDATRPTGDEKKPINDVIWSTTVAPDAWFATEGTKLYTDGGTGTMTLATMTGITAGEELTGLYDDGTNVYVASKAGAVYWSADGASWTRIAAPAISGTNPPLTRFAMLTGTTEKVLLVGSDGYGYYRLPTDPLGALTRFPTTTSPLYSAAVQKLYFDSIKNRVFACTSMGGLWRGAVAIPDGSIDWNLE
jgi:hypothetical protein